MNGDDGLGHRLEARAEVQARGQAAGGLVAVTDEQLALITDGGFHGGYFGWVVEVDDGTADKLVSAAGVAPAVAPSRTGHVAATPRAVCPGAIRKSAGDLVSLEAGRAVPGRRPAERLKARGKKLPRGKNQKGRRRFAPPARENQQRTNTVTGSLPCGHGLFAVDVSVFGAHLLRSP